MKTFFDLIQDNNFRDYVCKRIEDGAHQAYSFPAFLPKLYKYRPLSSHAIDDVINGKISMRCIGDFNDVFDGAIHLYGSDDEIEIAAEERWEEMETHRIAAKLPEGILRKDDIVNPYKEYLKRESRLKLRELDYLGTYVCCFSKSNTSTLMWSHYADSNKGMCLEYDFNALPCGDLLRNSIFPVVYTDKPVDVSDLLKDQQGEIYKYPLDAAVLCSALNKASIWKYEQEWRLIWVLLNPGDTQRRFSIETHIQPSKVYLGYHFLKPFFYYNLKSSSENKTCEKKIGEFLELILFLQRNQIPIAVMLPTVGSYSFMPHDIPTDDLYNFLLRRFSDNQPKSIRFYYTVHDMLMELIDNTREVSHA